MSEWICSDVDEGYAPCNPSDPHEQCNAANWPEVFDLEVHNTDPGTKITAMGDAIRRQVAHGVRSRSVDRAGWSDQQWADDAKELMAGADGAITSLVNGHVLALLRLREEALGGVTP